MFTALKMRAPIFLILLFITLTAHGQKGDKYQTLVDSLVKTGQQGKLIPYFERENKAHPGNVNILRWLGILHANGQQYETAEKYYKEALKIDPKCARCYMNLGNIAAAKSNYTQAANLINKAMQLDGKDAQIYLLRAKLREATGEEKEALFDYNKAIELDPGSAQLYLERGIYNQKQGYGALALADYNKSIEIMPRYYDAYFRRAGYYYDNHILPEALADLNIAFGIDSSRAELYTARGAINYVLEKYTESERDYSRSIAMEPEDYILYNYRADARYKLEDMDGSCEDYRHAYELVLKKSPNDSLIPSLKYVVDFNCDQAKPTYYYQRGIAYYNLGKYDSAVSWYTQGLKKFPDNAMILSFRGNAYFSANDFKNALLDYDAAVANREKLVSDIKRKIDFADKPAGQLKTYAEEMIAFQRISMAESKAALGQYDEALAEINKGIADAHYTEAGKEVYLNVRGNILMEMGRTEDAIKDFDQCIALNRQFALPYINRAIAKVNGGRKERQAIFSIGGSYNLKTYNADWSYQLNNKKTSNSNIQSALEDCNKAIELDNRSAFFYYIRGQVKKLLMIDYCGDMKMAKALDTHFAKPYPECDNK